MPLNPLCALTFPWLRWPWNQRDLARDGGRSSCGTGDGTSHFTGGLGSDAREVLCLLLIAGSPQPVWLQVSWCLGRWNRLFGSLQSTKRPVKK
jgi:hypothetical protein